MSRRARPSFGPGGYTLPEMVMTAMLVAAVTMIGAPLMVQSTKFFLLNRARVDLQRQARETLSLVSRNLRQAQSATISISRDAGQPYYSRIDFRSPSGVAMTYKQNGLSLIEVVGARTRVMSKDLRFLSFSFPRSDDMTIVSVAVTLEKAIYEGKTKALHVASERIRVMN